jgi:hypothetical protein
MKPIQGIRKSNMSIFLFVLYHTVISLFIGVSGEFVVGIIAEWQDSL